MADQVRFLVIDGYNKEARAELVAGGASVAGELYGRVLKRCLPGAQCDVIFAADPDAALAQGVGLERYDGVVWTGSILTAYDDDPRVSRQIELARAIFGAGVPSFGSCWAAQIAVVAAGGVVQASPRGREMVVARKISLTPEGRSHPLYEGKPPVFDALTSHLDEISQLPPDSLVLASSPFTRVQAVAVKSGRSTFWGVQYHPEFDLHEMARIIHCRTDLLIEAGLFADREAASDYIDKLEALHQDPTRKDIAWLIGIDADIMDEAIRLAEVRNWINRLVLPNKQGK